MNSKFLVAAIALISSPALLFARKVVSVQDYAADSVDDYTPVVTAILKDHPSGNVRIVFPKGTYHFSSEFAPAKYHSVTNHDNGLHRFIFKLDGMSGVEVDGQGSEFIIDGTVVPFLIDSSSDVCIKNLSIDWKVPFFAQAEVVTSDLASKTLDLKFTDISPVVQEGHRVNMMNNGNEMYFLGEMMAFDPETGGVAYDAAKFTIGGPGSRITEVVSSKDGVLRLNMPAMRKAPRPGLMYVFKGPNGVNRLAPAIHMTGSKDVTLSNVTVHTAGGMAVIGEKTENIHLDGVRVCLKEGTDRVLTTTADATHFCNCKGLLLVENCYFEKMLDDAMNVHGTYAIVVGRENDRTLLVRLNHFQQWGYDFAGKGDVIDFVGVGNLSRKGSATVKSCEKINDSRYRIVFKDPVPENVGLEDGLENMTWYPRLVFRNNVISNNRARGILISIPTPVLVEGNVFSSMMSAILMTADLNHWAESGAFRDVTIRGNRFLDNCYGGKVGSLIMINPTQSKVPSGEYVNGSVVVEDNEFNSFDRSVMDASSIQNVVFRNNTIRTSGTYEPLYPDNPELHFNHCGTLEVEGNVFDRGYESRIVAEDISARKVENNRGLGKVEQ